MEINNSKKTFEDNGYLYLKKILNTDNLFLPYDLYSYNIDKQVHNSLVTYKNPRFYDVHTEMKFKLEKILDCKLNQTYFFDRYYFIGNELKQHLDRDACEISLTLHTGSNPVNIKWPFCIETKNGTINSFTLSPGDGILYKGCERAHWRDALSEKHLPKNYANIQRNIYYHQIFLHYVYAYGPRAHYSYDMTF